MSELPSTGPGADIESARLDAEDYRANFSEMHPPLNSLAALIEADRCYFCFDAPCTRACPTGIDVAGFIRRISSGNNLGAAHLILQENIVGGSCARVCPTEILCEQACVRNQLDQRPVSIGLLQRHAVDSAIAAEKQFFSRDLETDKRIAIVGSGPAGLACAHGLARHGHQVSIFEVRPKSGGLNEFGLAAYKMLDNFAEREIDYITAIGGIEIRYGQSLGTDFDLRQLQRDYDAVFVGVGLTGVHRLDLSDEDVTGIMNAVDYIASIRQSENLAELPVGRHVVIIGGGMTAIDIAAQIKLLGAEQVTLVYRRAPEAMSASIEEQAFAQTKGVNIRYHAKPHDINVIDGQIRAVQFECTETGRDGQLIATGEFFSLTADMVFKAIGQTLDNPPVRELELKNGRIRIDAERRTSLDRVWAGGDCVYGGEDLTVSAVEDGKRAAISMNNYLGSSPGRTTAWPV